MNENNQKQIDLASTLPSDIFIDHVFPYLDVFSVINLGSTCTYLQIVTNASLQWVSRIERKFGSIPDDWELINQYNGSYRRYFVEKACLRFDGVYVSKCVYYRRVRPIGNIHLTEDEKRTRKNESTTLIPVCYFRFLLFLPNCNRCLCMRSEASLPEVINVLKRCRSVLGGQKSVRQSSDLTLLVDYCGSLTSDESKKVRQVVVAECCFRPLKDDGEDNRCLGTVKLRYFEPSNFNLTRYLTIADLALFHHTSSSRPRYNAVLSWRNLTVTTEAYGDRPEHRCGIPLDSSHFKPFTFCRIRSMANYF